MSGLTAVRAFWNTEACGTHFVPEYSDIGDFFRRYREFRYRTEWHIPAFAAFEQLRRDRVEAMVKAARRTGNQKAPSNGLARTLRDLVLPFFLKMGVKSAEQAYAYHVDWDEPVTGPRRAKAA